MLTAPWARSPLVVAITLLWLSGCNSQVADYSGLELSQVTGVVTLDGKPLVGANVRFYAPDGISFSAGRTDAAGRYVLDYTSEQAGVTKGTKIVRITTGVSGEDESAGGEDGSAPIAVESVPARYNSASELQVTVDQPLHEFDFDLRSTP